VLYPSFALSHHPSPIHLGFGTWHVVGFLVGLEVTMAGVLVGDETGIFEGCMVDVGTAVTGKLVGDDEVITGIPVGVLVTGNFVGVQVGDTTGAADKIPDL